MNAIYARVSTEEQARSGYSLADQLKTGYDYFHALGIPEDEVEEFVDDGYSGEFLDRPDLTRLRDKTHGKLMNRIWVLDPDRLSRDDVHAYMLKEELEKNAVLHFHTGNYEKTPEGKLFFKIRASVATFEKEKIRERTMRGKRSKALQGKLTHNDRPLGYDYDPDAKNYVINSREAETVKLIFNTYLQHNMGVFTMAVHLKALGVKTKKGAWFSGGTLHRILTNEMYCGTKWAFKNYEKTIGYSTQKNKKIKKTKRTKRDPSEWIPVAVPAIITREVWEAAQLQMKQNQNYSSRRAQHDYLVRSVIRCACCGYAMIGMKSSKPNHTYHHYGCSSKVVYKRECDARLISSDKLDEMVWNKIYSLAKEGVIFTDLGRRKEEDAPTKERLTAHLSELKKNQELILRWVRAKTVEEDVAEKELQALSKEIAATQTALAATTSPTTDANKVTVEEILEAATFEQKRNIILKAGVKIFARRSQDNVITWSFSAD